MNRRLLAQLLAVIWRLTALLPYFLGGLMLFAVPACVAYILAYFLFAGDWKDETFTPYMDSFLEFAGPVIWAGGTAYLLARFRSYRASRTVSPAR